MKRLIDIARLITSILICQAAGFLGSLLTTPSIPTWYATLNKPFLTPPNWVFAPVWTTLFLLMGIALFLIWRQDTNRPQVRNALILFFIQLFLNLAWSAAFFGQHSILAGLAVIIILWSAILVTTILFFRVNRFAGLLLIPYLGWVGFAAVLNLAILIVNR